MREYSVMKHVQQKTYYGTQRVKVGCVCLIRFFFRLSCRFLANFIQNIQLIAKTSNHSLFMSCQIETFCRKYLQINTIIFFAMCRNQHLIYSVTYRQLVLLLMLTMMLMLMMKLMLKMTMMLMLRLITRLVLQSILLCEK